MSKAVKKATVAAGDNGSHITDITHEEVRDTVESQTAEVLVNNQIRLELKKFNLADAAIAEMKERYGALVIAGPDDKDGYKAVKEAWNDTRSKRTGLEKKGLQIRSGYGVITKAVKKEEDRLIELVTPLEEELYAKWKAIDDEKDRIKREQEEAEQRQLMARVEEVMVLGMTLRDGFYVVGDTISMDVATLRALPVDQYEKLKTAIVNKATELKKIADDKAEQKRREEQEFKRQQDELKKQQEEFQRQQSELKEQQEQMKRDQAEAARMKLDMRLTKLEALGMTRSGHIMNFDNGFADFATLIEDIAKMDEAAWKTTLLDHTEGIKARHDGKAKHEEEQRKDRIEKERKEKYIARAMETAGLNYSYTARAFIWENPVLALAVSFDELLAMSDDQILDKANNLADQRKAAIKKFDESKKKKEADDIREAKLALGDKDRYAQEHAAIATASTKMVPGEFKTKKYQQRAQNFLNRLTTLLNEFE